MDVDITSEGMHKVDWESLDSLKLAQLNEVVLQLLAGKGLVIMEGIHCLDPALTSSVAKIAIAPIPAPSLKT